MDSLDEHDAAVVHRAALECEAIAADLERLKAMIADAGGRLLASFNVVGTLETQAPRGEAEQRRLAGAISNAVTALQFQDMADQLTTHAQLRLATMHESLARIAHGVDPLLATSRLQPVRQTGMGAGSIDLF
ncbi:MAG TPA: hypothetical protein VMG60_04875 [Burkholderiaceae bacterium]|nr:hypothetical protein [Burkholderiaceae bacterium]